MFNSKKTKIVTTIGPSSDTEMWMEELIKAGANVFRFNMKHNSVEWHEERIARADQIAKRLGIPLGILIDLQGPEIRLETKDKAPVVVQAEELVEFHSSFVNDSVKLCIPHEAVFEIVKAGDELLIDDGFQEFTVVSVDSDKIVAKSLGDYEIKNRKGINLPGKDISLPSLIDADLAKLDMATRSKVDFVALSFCRRKADIDLLREEMKKRKIVAQVVAKIESQQAIDNLDEIIESTDAVMVARGDLGVEIPIEQLLHWQKQIIYRCRIARKPVIVATQMLQSMIDNPRPTRAEATDVGNAIWDGTDAVMLSGESANGKYPIKAVETMTKIAHFNEKKCFVPGLTPFAENSTEAVVSAAMKILSDHTNISPDVIMVFTQSGYTARVVSSFRPETPILAVSNSIKTVEELSLSFGVFPVYSQFTTGEYEAPHTLIKELKEKNVLKAGQTVLIIHGSHWFSASSNNALALVTA